MTKLKLKNLKREKKLAILVVVLLAVFGAVAIFSGNISGLRNDKISDSIQNQDSGIKFVSSKKDFKSGEDPELKFEYKKADKGVIAAAGARTPAEILAEYNNVMAGHLR